MSKIIYENQTNYISSLRKKPDTLIAEMEEFAKEKHIPILDWNAAELLEHFIVTSRSKRVLEIGTAIAYSSIRIARVMRKKGNIETIEKSKDNIELALGFIEKAGLSDKIKVLEGDALDILPKLNGKYDFIFLDADKEDYEKLFYYSLMLLKKRGVLFVDNLLWHGYAAARAVPPKYKRSAQMIRQFNKLFVSQNNLDAKIFPVGDGIGVGFKV